MKNKENDVSKGDTTLDAITKGLRKEFAQQLESLEKRMDARIKILQSRIDKKEDINYSRPTSPSHMPNH